MLESLMIPFQLAWPLALAAAWVAGEFGHRWSGLPRISIYGLAGFLFGNLSQSWLPPSETESITLLANIAFGLILFETGYRINLRWLKANPWIAAATLTEAVGTFAAVFAIAQWFGMPVVSASLTAALAMSTSPAGVLRVVNEQAASGQVTERLLHLCAFDSVLAVFAFKVFVGVSVFQVSGSLLHAVWSGLAVLIMSAVLGALFGVALPGLLRRLGNLAADATVAFAIAVILLVALTHALGFSPMLAALTFGMTARHRRITLNRAQRNFGALGDLLSVLLFFFVATTLHWEHVLAGLPLALLLIVARFIAKAVGVTAFAHAGGVSWRKGFLAGAGLAPISVLAILLIEQTQRFGVGLEESLPPLAAMALLLEVAGPVVTQRTLMAAKETHENEGA